MKIRAAFVLTALCAVSTATAQPIIAQLSGAAFEKVMPDGMTLPQFSVLDHVARRGGAGAARGGAGAGGGGVGAGGGGRGRGGGGGGRCDRIGLPA